MRRRWLVASVGAAFLVAAGLVASLALLLLPDPQTAAVHSAATPAADGQPALATGNGTPLPGGSATGPATAPGTPPSASATAAAGSTVTEQGRSTTPAPASGTAPLAGRIKPGVIYRGVATFYDADGGGACLFDPSGDVMTAAMNTADYEDAKACGAYVLVKAANGKSVTVRITNLCPGDCAVGQLDLSAEAFAKLAAPSLGRIPITWRLVSPNLSGTLSIRYKTGSSRYWCGIQVINHRNPLAQVEIRSGSTWRALSRSDYNYFLSPSGAGCGGSLRITDIYGQRLAVSGLPVKPNVIQRTRVQFAKH